MNEPCAVWKCACTHAVSRVKVERGLSNRVFSSAWRYIPSAINACTVTRAIFQGVTQIITGCSCSRSGKHLVPVVNLPGKLDCCSYTVDRFGDFGIERAIRRANVFTFASAFTLSLHTAGISFILAHTAKKNSIESFIEQTTRKSERKLLIIASFAKYKCKQNTVYSLTTKICS